jgi:hypothetical protein
VVQRVLFHENNRPLLRSEEDILGGTPVFYPETPIVIE